MTKLYRIWVGLTAVFCSMAASQSWADENDSKSNIVWLDTVLVEAYKDGSAADGYRVDAVRNLGPWGNRKVLDTPYSVSIMSSEFMSNITAQNPQQVYRVIPTTYSGSYELNANNYFYTRGFVGNYAYVDGIPNNNISYGLNLEDIDNVEIISGLSGFFYGFSQVGGTAIYNLKRPTSEPVHKVKVGNYGGGQYYAHVDLGGPIQDGKFGYRFNAMHQDGDTLIEGQSLERTVVSGAVDYNMTEDSLLQFNAGYSKFDREGNQMAFDIRRNNLVNGVPSPRDPSKLWAPEGTFSDIEGYNLGLALKSYINDTFRIRTAFNHRDDTRKMIYTNNANFSPDLSTYTFSLSGGKWQYISDGYYAYLDTNFDTFGIEHTLTTGLNGSYRTNKTAVYDGNAIFQFGPAYTFPIWDHSSARRVQVPDWNLNGNMKKQMTSSNLNSIIGDDIRINEQWSILAGLNYTQIETKNYNAPTGRMMTAYEKDAYTPSVSAMFKPQPNITTYVSYMEGLEQGAVVRDVYANAGEVLKPLRSEQHEVGVKAEIQQLMLTAALFQIDKPNEYANSANYYVQDGRQVHQGLELTIQGRLFEDLTIWGGFTYLDPEVKTTDNPLLEGKQPYLVPKTMAKMYAEYDLPFLEGLTLTGGVYYIGTRYADNLNTNELPAYTIGDLGARYTAALIDGLETTFRLNVTNIGNKRYWLDQPLGPQRAVVFSVEASF